jgi:hypothetical protein
MFVCEQVSDGAAFGEQVHAGPQRQHGRHQRDQVRCGACVGRVESMKARETACCVRTGDVFAWVFVWGVYMK